MKTTKTNTKKSNKKSTTKIAKKSTSKTKSTTSAKAKTSYPDFARSKLTALFTATGYFLIALAAYLLGEFAADQRWHQKCNNAGIKLIEQTATIDHVQTKWVDVIECN